LHRALDVAVDKDVISTNPAKKATAPIVTQSSDRPAFTEENAARFLAAWEGQRLRPAFAIALTLGLRRGELLGPNWRGDDYIFTSEAGTPLHPDNLVRSFKAGLKRASLPDIRFHDLHHCAGSLRLAQGEDIEGVTSVLGHSSRAITEKLYAHALRDRKKRAGESRGFLLRREG